MQIISQTQVIMAGANPTAYPLPSPLPGNNTQANYLAVQNFGPCDCMVQLGNNFFLAPATEGASLVGAPSSSSLPGALNSGDSPFVAIALQTGLQSFSVVANPVSIGVATTGTASSGSTSLTVASGTGIVEGQNVAGAGIAPGTTVQAISGTTVTLSQNTTAALSGTPVTFSTPASPQPPGLLAIALGI
jgi:hypothetical protein